VTDNLSIQRGQPIPASDGNGAVARNYAAPPFAATVDQLR